MSVLIIFSLSSFLFYFPVYCLLVKLFYAYQASVSAGIAVWSTLCTFLVLFLCCFVSVLTNKFVHSFIHKWNAYLSLWATMEKHNSQDTPLLYRRREEQRKTKENVDWQRDLEKKNVDIETAMELIRYRRTRAKKKKKATQKVSMSMLLQGRTTATSLLHGNCWKRQVAHQFVRQQKVHSCRLDRTVWETECDLDRTRPTTRQTYLTLHVLIAK